MKAAAVLLAAIVFASVDKDSAAANIPPTVSQIPDQYTTPDWPIIIPVSIGDAETATEDLIVSATSSEDALPPSHFTFSCGVATRYLSIQPPTTFLPTADITVSVFDADGATAATTFRVFTVSPCNGPVTISAISNQQAVTGSPTAPIPFVVGYCATPAPQLETSGSSFNTNLVRSEALFFAGTGSQRSLVAIPEPDKSGTATIQVHVRSPDGLVAATAFDLTIEPRTGGPTIISQPRSVRAFAGESVLLTVALTGAAPFSYQWLRGEERIAAETNGVLRFNPFGPGNAGDYKVLVRNVAGNATSHVAQARVREVSLTRSPNGSFEIQTAGDPGERYAVSTSCDLRTWFPLGTVTNETGVVTLTDPDSAKLIQRFYRVSLSN